jgi:hypothetical protein
MVSVVASASLLTTRVKGTLVFEDYSLHACIEYVHCGTSSQVFRHSHKYTIAIVNSSLSLKFFVYMCGSINARAEADMSRNPGL